MKTYPKFSDQTDYIKDVVGDTIVPGSNQTFQDQLTAMADREVSEALSDTSGKYHQAIQNPDSNPSFRQEILRLKRGDERTYFESVKAFCGLSDLDYGDYSRIKSSEALSDTDNELRGVFAKASVAYEEYLQTQITPAAMYEYLLAKLSRSIHARYQQLLWRFRYQG